MSVGKKKDILTFGPLCILPEYQREVWEKIAGALL